MQSTRRFYVWGFWCGFMPQGLKRYCGDPLFLALSREGSLFLLFSPVHLTVRVAFEDSTITLFIDMVTLL